ncbi:MAG: hypothetical protein HY859_09735 [Caulobacterales bacterium]|nr:hypothetical protein [Caulobacterales bacterium]
MRIALVLPALLTLITAVPMAMAGEVTTDATTATKPWYIGPKGGDTRKGHTASPSELWTSVHGNAPAAAVAASPKPWYIGPKGGDTRKGHSPSPSELWVAVHGNDPAPAVESAAATPKPWYIGPKGGDTRKGAFRR